MPATALDPRSALVVIDLQKGLSRYSTLRPFAEVAENAARLAAAFRRAELPVVLVSVRFSADGGNRPSGRTDAPAPNLPTADEFYELVPELDAKPSDILIRKRQWSAFYGTDLDLQLRRRHVTNIVLAGISTSVGVDSTARAAHERAYNLTFASDAITDTDQEAHDHSLKKIFPRLGQIDSTAAILALVKPRA